MFEDIEVFCAIARNGSLAKAARSLYISTSIVTRRLARLEAKLGVRLMQRTTRHVFLTEAGQFYYDEVSQILDNLEASNKNVKSLGKEIVGTLKIGLPVSISTLYVSQHLHEFLALYPSLKIQIVHGNHILDILENAFDVVLHCGKLPDSSFYFKKLGNWDKIICASPEYLAKYGTPKTPADLSQHNCLDHAENFHFTWRFDKDGNTEDMPVSGNVRVNSSLDLASLAASGLGIAYLPCFSVHPLLKAGKLISILEDYRPPALGMYLVYPSNKYLSQKTQVFIHFMEKLLGKILNFA